MTVYRGVKYARLVFVLAIGCLPTDLAGQDPPSADAAATAPEQASPTLSTADVKAALAAIEADPEINEQQKSALKKKYDEITKSLEQAADFGRQTSIYQGAQETSPKNAAQSTEQLQSLPSVEAAGETAFGGTTQELEKQAAAARATAESLSDEQQRVSAELLRTEGRPVEISTRLPEAQAELLEIEKQLDSPQPPEPSASKQAERFLLRADYTRLVSEIEMMRQEQLSQSVRVQELEARRDLLNRQVENAKATSAALNAQLQQKRSNDVENIRLLTEGLSEDLPDDEAVQQLAAEITELVQQYESVVKDLATVAPAVQKVKQRLAEISAEYEGVRRELKLGSGGAELSQVLMELARRARPGALKLQVPTTLERARLDWFSVKRRLRGQAEIEAKFADQTSGAVQRLVSARRKILVKHQQESANLTQALATLETDKQRYLNRCEEVQSYIAEQLFGFDIRSCPPFGPQSLIGIPAGLTWLFSAAHWTEMGAAFWQQRYVVAAVLLIAVLLLLMRPRLLAALHATEPPTRRLSTDHYQWTSKALYLTGLLAAPIPIMFALTAWVFQRAPDPSEWMLGTTNGLSKVTWILTGAVFIYHACRPNGLGIVHFGWDERFAARASAALKSTMPVYALVLTLVGSCMFGLASAHLDSVGLVSFVLLHIWIAFVIWKLFPRSDDTVKSQPKDSNPRLTAIWRSIRIPLMIAAPIALIAIAGAGYVMTAADLSLGLLFSAGIIAIGQILYDLARRAYEIRQRRLAFTEALAERRSRLSAAAHDDTASESNEMLQLDEEEELGLDLDKAGDQTVTVLRLFFNVGIILVLYNYWSSVIPLTAALDTIPIPLTGGLSLLTLVIALLVVIFTVVTVRNLPGLLEFTILRTSTIEAGTRNAIYTLCQYAVIGLGLIGLTNILNLDWAKLGWMAAALSVGLGFGLQEVVANFVSGLIVLFERPIRVGDVVTIEGTTGTVTKINMRATTITNWDRQDFVVPNKNLITGTILNWTLSAPVNRVVIPVGVAYGTDTDQALQILLDVATEHPNVMDDPKPSASFDQFADSSMNLVLRACLPNMDNRMSTTTQLNTEIAKRFTAAGIEIAHPQRDLHLRSGLEALERPSSEDDSLLGLGKPH